MCRMNGFVFQATKIDITKLQESMNIATSFKNSQRKEYLRNRQIPKRRVKYSPMDYLEKFFTLMRKVSKIHRRGG